MKDKAQSGSVDDSITPRLGFAEKIDEDELFYYHSTHFPSKIGGKPAWLHMKLPTPEKMACKLCSVPMTFVCQIYAPLDDVPQSFHRTIFVFVCLKCNNHFRALRSNLPQANEFYNEDLAPEDYEPAMQFAKSFDEKHPDTLSTEKHVLTNLPEYFVVVEDEPGSDCESQVGFGDENESEGYSEIEDNEEQPLPDDLSPAEDSPNDDEIDENEIDTKSPLAQDPVEESDSDGEFMDEKERAHIENLRKKYEKEGGVPMDKSEIVAFERLQADNTHGDAKDLIFRTFRKRCTREPGQVLRYHKGQEPLWYCKTGILEKKDGVMPPRCRVCGGEREFEFQLQPQLMAKIPELEGLEYGILAVYTCKNDCAVPESAELGGYVEEFIYRQREPAV